MRVATEPATTPDSATLIHQLAGVVAPDAECEITSWRVRLTGRVGSWHGKQIASETARRAFPGLRVDNQLQVDSYR